MIQVHRGLQLNLLCICQMFLRLMVVASKPFNSTTTLVQANAAYTESPTIASMPLQGENFARQILTPIGLDKIYLLLQSGWSLARVLRVTTQALGNIPNAPSAARPSSSHIPEYKQFEELAHYM